MQQEAEARLNQQQAQAAADAEKEKREEEEDKAKVEAEGGSESLQKAKLDKLKTDRELNGLKDKIKQLQVQLRVQHVSALQTTNAETRHLQLEIQQSVLATSNEEENGGKDVSNPGKSILPLLAEFIDSSLLELRLDTEALLFDISKQAVQHTVDSLPTPPTPMAPYSDMVTPPDLPGLDSPSTRSSQTSSRSSSPGNPTHSTRTSQEAYSARHNMQQGLLGLVRKHLGWMLALAPTHPLLSPGFNPVNVTPTGGDKNGEDKDDSAGTAKEAEDSENQRHDGNAAPISTPTAPSSPPTALALLPDPRSKVLWLSSLVQKDTLTELVVEELRGKITFLDSATLNEYATKYSGYNLNDYNDGKTEAQIGSHMSDDGFTSEEENSEKRFSDYFAESVVLAVEHINRGKK